MYALLSGTDNCLLWSPVSGKSTQQWAILAIPLHSLWWIRTWSRGTGRWNHCSHGHLEQAQRQWEKI
jgi:hypothetical protein